MKAGAFFF